MRINNMLNPEDTESKSDFRYLKSGRAYKMIASYVKNQKQRDRLVELVGDDKLTSFQLYDILHLNYTYESIKKEIKK